MNKPINKNNDSIKKSVISVRKASFDSLILYEISEHELDELEKGSPISLYLNFSIFLLSVGFSFLVTLIFTESKSTKIFLVFLVVTVLFLVIGIFLILLWFKNRKIMNKVVQKIRNRMIRNK